MEKIKDQYNLKEIKLFFKHLKGHKFECFYKLIFAYKLSRFEILNLKWKDIDFENNKITIYPVKYYPNGSQNRYNWRIERVEEFARTYPLLPHIKKLLEKEYNKQKQNSIENADFVCLKQNGNRLNANTLSRNIKYLARDNKLPETLLSGIKNSAEDFFIKKARDPDFYRCWTRFDILERHENIYKNFNLFKNKYFVNALDNLIDRQKENEM